MNLRRRASLSVQRGLQAIAIEMRVVGLEFGLVPVLLERGSNAIDDVRALDFRHSHVPLESVEEG